MADGLGEDVESALNTLLETAESIPGTYRPEFGSHPLLVTTSANSGAHVVSVAVDFDGTNFVLSAGWTSRSNIAGNASVALLWPGTGGCYGLIVEGTGNLDADDEEAISLNER